MQQGSLFDDQQQQNSPLANRVRPETLADFIGQQQILGDGQILQEIIANDQLSSMIFWGAAWCW